jgi:hypothetical protein
VTEQRAVEATETDTQSWDDFWAEVTPAQRTETICGVEVLVPQDMPLNLAARLEQLEQSESEDDLHELVSLLFGEGALEDWTAEGMTVRQFQVALAWGIAHANGQNVSFAEAAARVQAAEQGKAQPNRAARRAAARPRSAGTGGRSSRTSTASTASMRKRSGG